MYFTRRQLDVLTFLQLFREENGISPTLEEMARHFGLTKITIYEHVNQLERKRAITRDPRRTRSIQVVNPPPARTLPRVPITGFLREGFPIEATEEPEGIDPKEFLPIGPAFQALRVAGDSLAGEHLFDGDLVILERREPRDGEVVVGIVDEGGATLGRLFQEHRRQRLQSANGGDWKRYPKSLRVRGVVVGVLRRFAAAAAQVPVSL